jgi:hypothetical protein
MTRQLLEVAYRRFHDARDALPQPASSHFQHDLSAEVNAAPWRMFMEVMIEDHLSESTNYTNEWCMRLRDWQAWLDVIDAETDKQQAMEIQWHFVVPLVFWCMLRPSAMRDLFGFIATHAVHQANLVVDRNYRDRLDEDAENRYMKRDQREQQLRRIGARWPGCKRFAACLTKVDSRAYRDRTFDYRNLASHGMAPRFEFGHTNFVRRAAVSKSEVVPQMDRSFSSEATSGKKTVRYDFGGTPPLKLREMHAANQSEFAHARAAFEAYRDLLRELLAAIRSAAAEGPH